jgi:hypothetical protein
MINRPALCLVLVLLSGCGGAQRVQGGTWLATGKLLTPGTSISAEDGSWTITAGQEFPLPPDLAQKPGATCETGVEPVGTRDFTAWEQNGAMRVRVQAPGLEQPLYGIYALCAVTREAFPMGAYEIQVPEQYVAEASAGSISVVYQESSSHQHVYSWVIWLSRTPFPPAPPKGE